MYAKLYVHVKKICRSVVSHDPTTFAQTAILLLLAGFACLEFSIGGHCNCSESDDVCRYQSPGWGRGSSQDQWGAQYVGCNISLADNDGRDAWWQLQCQVLDDKDEPVDNSQQGWSTCKQGGFNGPRVVAVLERVQTGFLGQTLSSFGITGLYITFVFGIGRFLRLAATNSRMRIMYEDLPTTKRLIALCQDIYIARAQGELALEEELYWALINIYRSPAVLFELTKKKEV